MTFVLTDINGGVTEAENVLSYEWSRDISAPCDAVRLTFLYESEPAEICRLDAFLGKTKVFGGYADFQSVSDGKCFIYARSSACVLVDNEASALTYNSPCVRSLFIINAKPFGFENALENYSCTADYTVSKGTSCYGAISNFVSAFSDSPVLVNPDGVLYIPQGKTCYAVNRSDILSEKKTVSRGGAVGRIDYKTDGDYVHHRESRTLEEKGIRRSRKLNVSAVSPWQQSSILSRILSSAAADYYGAELTVSGVVSPELLSPVVLEGYEGYRITALNSQYGKDGAKTRITLAKRLDLKEIDYVAQQNY